MERNNDSILYRLLRPIVKCFVKIFYRPKMLGLENIPKEGRIILAGNHTNIFDCLLLISSTKRSIHFLAKDELWKGMKKILFSNLGLIPVNRRQKDHNALESAYSYLREEQLIGIFPEGTIGKKGILPFKMGAVKMASVTNTKIVPFAITGKYKFFSNNLKIVFGKSIKIKSKDLEKENDNLREVIIKMVGVK